jgi:hypothetical protein
MSTVNTPACSPVSTSFTGDRSRASKGQTTMTGPKISSDQIGVVARHVGEHRRGHERTAPAAVGHQRRLDGHGSLHLTGNPLRLADGDHRADIGLGAAFAAHKGFGAPGDRGQGAVVNAAVHQHPLHGEAALTGGTNAASTVDSAVSTGSASAPAVRPRPRKSTGPVDRHHGRVPAGSRVGTSAVTRGHGPRMKGRVVRIVHPQT